MSVYHLHAGVGGGQKRTSDPLGTGVIDSWALCGCWELNLSFSARATCALNHNHLFSLSCKSFTLYTKKSGSILFDCWFRSLFCFVFHFDTGKGSPCSWSGIHSVVQADLRLLVILHLSLLSAKIIGICYHIILVIITGYSFVLYFIYFQIFFVICLFVCLKQSFSV